MDWLLRVVNGVVKEPECCKITAGRSVSWFDSDPSTVGVSRSWLPGIVMHHTVANAGH